MKVRVLTSNIRVKYTLTKMALLIDLYRTITF